MGKHQQFLWVTWLELLGELCARKCLSTRRKRNASGVGYRWQLSYFERTLYSRGDWRVSSRGTSRKMGSGYIVLNHIRVSLQSLLLSTHTYFSEGFWTNDFSSCLDVLLSKGFQMWTHFRKKLHQHYCFSGEHLKRGTLICSKSAHWIRASCSAGDVHCTPQDSDNVPFGASSWVVL